MFWLSLLSLMRMVPLIDLVPHAEAADGGQSAAV